MVICCDIDGVLANFNHGYARRIIKVTKRDLFPKHWYRVPDIVSPVWDWEYHWGYTSAERDKVITSITSQYDDGFWFKLPLMPHAKDSLACLNNLQRYSGHEIYFLTHRFGHKAKLQTERWLYQYGIAYPTVLLVDAKDKHKVLQALNADIFIDDKLETVRSSVGSAKRVYLKDMPYNQDEMKSPYTRVQTIKDMLIKEGLWAESEAKVAMFWRRQGE